MARHDARSLAEAEARLPAPVKRRGDASSKDVEEAARRERLTVAARGVLERLSRLKVPAHLFMRLPLLLLFHLW